VVRLLFVCLGNICRSPTAEGVMAKIILDRGWQDQVAIDSAGTAACHVGERADERSRSAALRRGVELLSRARQVAPEDYDRFDYLVAMDRSNLAVLERRAPARARAEIVLLRSFDATAPEGAEVPDPYYGGADGFEDVLDICERACLGLATHIERKHLGG